MAKKKIWQNIKKSQNIMKMTRIFKFFFDSQFHQKLDCHKVFYFKARLQEVVRIVVKCYKNHFRKKYIALNNNSGAGKNAFLIRLKEKM